MEPGYSCLLIHEQVIPERRGVYDPWAAVLHQPAGRVRSLGENGEAVG